jgi:phosphodiesterase/alkaline phosphatase D-like protein
VKEAAMDDHETPNNWSPGKDLSGDAGYTEKRILTQNAEPNGSARAGWYNRGYTRSRR